MATLPAAAVKKHDVDSVAQKKSMDSPAGIQAQTFAITQ